MMCHGPHRRCLLALCLLMLGMMPQAVHAQEPPADPPLVAPPPDVPLALPVEIPPDAPPVPPPPPVNTPGDAGIKSLFFNAQERDAIEQVKKQFLERDTSESEADLLDQLQGIKSQRPEEEELQEKNFAQFYLETLIYRSPQDWTVWVKEADQRKKYTTDSPAAPGDLLRVISIAREEAMFEWHPKNWLYINNTYKQDNPNIRLDTARKMVIFTLRVNQTLTSIDMQIKEGVIAPGSGAPPPASAPASPNAPPVPGDAGAEGGPVPIVMPAAPDTSQLGIQNGGVLSLYKNLESPQNIPQDEAVPQPEPVPTE